jgi:ketosteroid isomerase-like protein
MMHEIAAAERGLYDAMTARDFAALDAILADDVVYVHSTAVAETKTGYLAAVRDGLYEYGSIDSIEAAAAFIGDVAVQTGASRMLVGARGQPKAPINLLVTLVWKREPQGWRLWRRHATRILSI